MDKDTVTDGMVMGALQGVVATDKKILMPNIPAFFEKELKLDLTQTDVRERIFQYFRLFWQLVEEESLEGCFVGNEGVK
ncbi:hypothetical protein GN244_ATG09748 [Phytophthora infestans]|uniref:Uncharacterized protein n=1 Tax=Phytophthora infestans TaxID=4787 RepID=A0A833WDC9_PHYIN|nr:hypothetical protein GN244_ATG09748 [Phytophthora infestans]